MSLCETAIRTMVVAVTAPIAVQNHQRRTKGFEGAGAGNSGALRFNPGDTTFGVIGGGMVSFSFAKATRAKEKVPIRATSVMMFRNLVRCQWQPVKRTVRIALALSCCSCRGQGMTIGCGPKGMDVIWSINFSKGCFHRGLHAYHFFLFLDDRIAYFMCWQ